MDPGTTAAARFLCRARSLLAAPILVGTQVPLEERPGAVPRIALIRGIVALERLRVGAAVEGVTAARRARYGVDVHLRLGEIRLARPQRIDNLLILDVVDVGVVGGDVDEERDPELVNVVERR